MGRSMRASIVVAIAALSLVAVILLWRGLTPADPVGLSGVQAEPVLGEEGTVQVFLTMETGDFPDVLISAESPAAETVEIISPAGKSQLTIPARSTPSLSGDGAYLRLTGIEGEVSAGRLIPVTLTFLRSGDLSVRARVGENDDPHAKHRAMAAMADDPDGPVPQMTLALEPAANGATLVRLEVENFTFDPGSDTPEHVPGHGHGHLYLDGLKLQRMYTSEALIGALPQGDYEVKVELNSNLHVPYRDTNGPVAATARLVVE